MGGRGGGGVEGVGGEGGGRGGGRGGGDGGLGGGGGGREGWWWWSRRDVYDMSLTICHNSPAPSSQLSRPTAGTCRCGNTATSPTVDELHHVIDNTAPVVAHNGYATTVHNSTNCNCGSSTVSSTSALENWTCINEINHLIDGLQVENLYGKKTKGSCICATTGMASRIKRVKFFEKASLTDATHASTVEPESAEDVNNSGSHLPENPNHVLLRRRNEQVTVRYKGPKNVS